MKWLDDLANEWKQEKGKRYVVSEHLGTTVTGREQIVYRLLTTGFLLSIVPTILAISIATSGLKYTYQQFMNGACAGLAAPYGSSLHLPYPEAHVLSDNPIEN